MKLDRFFSFDGNYPKIVHNTRPVVKVGGKIVYDPEKGGKEALSCKKWIQTKANRNQRATARISLI